MNDTPKSSKIIETDWIYPNLLPSKSGLLPVGSKSAAHRIYWEEYGNPAGEPLMFFHGGPGGGCRPTYARFFDPGRYRIILFDQRGCGKSEPSVAAQDARPGLTDNTTDHLISDILQLRAALAIHGKMHVFGGSWGSTLAMAYAIKHPETVETLILRGIFLCRKQDLDYFYQGNAAVYAKNPNDTSMPGAYLVFPQAWKNFVEVIPESKRDDMVKAYSEIFAMVPKNDAELAAQTAAAKAWSIWEGTTSYLQFDPKDLAGHEDPAFAKAFAKIENHYFMNGCFLGGSGDANRSNDYLLQSVDKIKHIPIYVVHGRYDQVCPMFQAEALVAALKKVGAQKLDYRLTVAGHSVMERDTHGVLMDIMKNLPKMPGYENNPANNIPPKSPNL